MNVDVIASEVSDNFFFLLDDGAGRAALIDPIDGDKAVARVRQAGLDLQMVINTHMHPDHIGGNDTVFAAFGEARLVAGAGDASAIDSQQGRKIDERITGGDTVQLGDVSLQVLDTPGHTPGHVSLLADAHLFSGDTIFVGGAGNCKFGGDPSVLFRTFRDVLSELDPQIVFYPGHDYAVRNLEFAKSIEPDNDPADELLDEARQCKERGELFTTTLGIERDYNPFMRYDDPALAERLASEHAEVYAAEKEHSQTRDEAVFRTVRELRNRW
jgi:hydroxyacylglutathione hydrolase